MKIILIQRIVPQYRVALFSEIYNILQKEGIEFVVLCGNDIRGTKSKNADQLPVFIKNCLKSNDFIRNKINLFYNLYSKLNEERPSVIISEGGANTINNMAVFLYAKRYNISYVIWDLGKFRNWRQEKKKILEYFYAKIYKKIILSSKGILTYNNAALTYFQTNFNIPKSDIQVLHNTIDSKSILEAMSHPVIDPDFEIFASRFRHILLFVGAIEADKNLGFLSKVQKQLGDGYGLLIIGGGLFLKELKAMSNPEWTFFTGNINDLNKLAYYYNKSSVFLLPGLGGLAINQSMAYGIPVICSIADGSEFDLIIEGQTGFIAPENNTDAWIEKIEYICSKPVGFFKEGCINHISNNFALSVAAENFIKTVKDIIY